MIDFNYDTTTEYDDAETAALLYEIDVSVSARLLEDRGSGGPLNREIHYSRFDLAEAEADEMARARGEI